MGRSRTRKPGPLIEYGERIAKARGALKMTQLDLADALKVAQTRISKLENGHTGFQTKDFIRLLRYLAMRGVNVDGFILTGTTEEPLRDRAEADMERRLAAVEKRLAVR